VTASKGGYISASQTVTVTAGETKTVNFELPVATGTIKGKVADSKGSAIVGATVSAAGKSTTTSGSGTYTLSEVPVGTQTVTARKGGYISVSQTVTVTAGETKTVNFKLLKEDICVGPNPK
jgi:iron complex outermembrane receptor protein